MIYEEIFQDIFKDILRAHNVLEFDGQALQNLTIKLRDMRPEKGPEVFSLEFTMEMVKTLPVVPTDDQRECLCSAAMNLCDYIRRGRHVFRRKESKR